MVVVQPCMELIPIKKHIYNRVLIMHWDIAIMELWKGSEYAMFLQRQVLHKILNMPQNG